MLASDILPGLDLWHQTRGGAPTLINLSENHTFRIDTPAGPPFILRVHRPAYQSAESISSELAWLEALHRDTGLPVPRPLPGRDGALLQTLPLPSGSRYAVLFAFEPGREPQPADDLAALFKTIGRFAAIAHRHAQTYAPLGFVRQRWSAGAILDPDGLWGDWRKAPHVSGAIADTLSHLDARLRVDLAAYGQGRDRFGLIHADMRLANLLVDADRVTLIDFDDCGFCWFMYDFAAAISFYEDHPQVPVWRQNWLNGYHGERPLQPADIEILDAMVLLRRMALLAWIGSHAETTLARGYADRFAAVTADLARAYLK